MKFTNLDHVDVWTRAAKTAGEAFVAALLASGLSWTHLSVTKSIVLGAVSAAVTAVVNYFLQVVA